MDPEKKKLKDLHSLVHHSLRRLKMGETATIQASADHPAEDIINYMWAYSFHKRKWFEARNDKTARVVYAERKPPPPWEKPDEEDEEEEV